MSTEVEEPLELSAGLAWQQSALLCPRSTDPEGGCFWYHRPWQYLRLLGVISTARTNRSFIVDFFAERAARVASDRVLISATADYAMLAYVSHAYRVTGTPLRVTVVDRCETSLLLNRWYADRYEIDLETRRCDALDVEADGEPFDVVCTHNFMGRLETADRERLLALWHRLLRPSGQVITTQRIRRRSDTAVNRFTPEQAVRFRDRTEAAARSYPGPLCVSPSDIADAAYSYAINKNSGIIKDPNEVLEPLCRAGFEIVHWDRGTDAERALDRPAVPIDVDDYRMRLVARRRDSEARAG